MAEQSLPKEQVKEFLEHAKDMADSFIVAGLTDEYIVDQWPEMKNTLLGKEDKILEIRIFNRQKEKKLFRGDIGKRFHERTRSDEELKEEFYDESQLLDIDEKRSKRSFADTGRVQTTGGGSYYLPLPSMKDARVIIRYYLSRYERSGQARISDWRLVAFQNGKSEGEV